MTFYDLAIRNMKRSFKNYWLYILSTSFSIIIFYVFLNIKYDKTIIMVSKGVAEYGVMFSMVSVIIAVFTAIFIWYSNSFFMKERKKEIALFILAGIKKSKIGRMIFLENLVVGLLSLLLGLSGGILLSKLFVMILLRLMMINVPIVFYVSVNAIITTVIIFSLLLLIASIHGYIIVFRVQLIELFSAARKRETEPKNRPIRAALSIIFIGTGYYLSRHLNPMNFGTYALIILSVVIIGTYLLFSSTFITMIKIIKKRKSFFYRSSHMVTFSNLQYRVKNHSRMLALIAILSATSISSIGAVYGTFVVVLDDLNADMPYSYVFYDNNKNATDEIYDIIGSYKQHPIQREDHIELLTVSGDLIYTHYYDNVQDEIKKDMNVIGYSQFEFLMKERGLNITDKPDNNSCLYVSTNYSNEQDDLSSEELTLNNKEFNIIKGYKFGLSNATHDGMLYVISDYNYEIFKQNADNEQIKNIVGISVKDQIFSKDLTDELDEKVARPTGLLINNYYYSFINMSQVRAIVLFTGLFLGLVFLTATGSIIYFKLITEAENDAGKYIILSKIGISNREIIKSMGEQILIIFILPLIVGIIHASFALVAFGDMLVGDEKNAFIVAIVFYILVYTLYYFLTLHHYKRKIVGI